MPLDLITRISDSDKDNKEKHQKIRSIKQIMVSSQPIVSIILSAIGAVYGSGEEGVRINEFKVRNAYV